MSEAEDFGEALTPELREAEERLRQPKASFPRREPTLRYRALR